MDKWMDGDRRYRYTDGHIEWTCVMLAYVGLPEDIMFNMNIMLIWHFSDNLTTSTLKMEGSIEYIIYYGKTT